MDFSSIYFPLVHKDKKTLNLWVLNKKVVKKKSSFFFYRMIKVQFSGALLIDYKARGPRGRVQCSIFSQLKIGNLPELFVSTLTIIMAFIYFVHPT